MKKLLKISSYTLATIIAFVMSQGTVLAAGNATDNAGLSGGQVVGGLSILLLAILVPTIKKARKAA
jgi:hypothetical protein